MTLYEGQPCTACFPAADGALVECDICGGCGYILPVKVQLVITTTRLPGALLVQPVVHRDARGFFLETYHQQRYAAAGLRTTFVQTNHSGSVKGTVRGLHMQVKVPQAKLVRVLSGEIFDVAVDLRVGSPTFAQWVGVHLDSMCHQQLFVPEGFAHGFAVLSERAEVEYKCSAFYDPCDEATIRFDDPAIGVVWPVDTPLLSSRDATAASLADVMAARGLVQRRDSAGF